MIKKLLEMVKKNRQSYEEDHEIFDEPIIEWTAPTHHVHERGVFWLIGFSLFITTMVVYGVIDGNWTMATGFILVTLVYYFEHQKPVRYHTIKVSVAGIKVGNKIISYTLLNGFWFVYHPPFVKTVHFSFHKKHRPNIHLQLADCDHDILKKTLLRHLHEFEGREESLSDIFARAFKL